MTTSSNCRWKKAVGISIRSPRFLRSDAFDRPMDFTVVRNACSQFRGMRSRKFAQRGAVCCHLSFPASYAAFRFDAACHPRFRADATTGHRSPSPPLPRLTDGSPSMREMRIHPRVCDCELNHRTAQAYIGRKKRKEEKKGTALLGYARSAQLRSTMMNLRDDIYA